MNLSPFLTCRYLGGILLLPTISVQIQPGFDSMDFLSCFTSQYLIVAPKIASPQMLSAASAVACKFDWRREIPARVPCWLAAYADNRSFAPGGPGRAIRFRCSSAEYPAKPSKDFPPAAACPVAHARRAKAAIPFHLFHPAPRARERRIPSAASARRCPRPSREFPRRTKQAELRLPPAHRRMLLLAHLPILQNRLMRTARREKVPHRRARFQTVPCPP